MEKEQNHKVNFALIAISVLILGITGFAIGFIATRGLLKKAGNSEEKAQDAPDMPGVIKATSTPNYGGGTSYAEKPYVSPPDSVVEAAYSGSDEPAGFPLKRLSGIALHTSNPFVKDVQQYCNKKGNLKIDIDGAFGKETENAVMLVLGTKTVSWTQYKTIIAPYLGK